MQALRCCIFLAALLPANPGFSQEALCDPILSRFVNRNDPDRYYQRKDTDRCEGLYNQPVSNDNGSLWVASFTSGAWPAKWQGPLELQWRSQGKEPVTIQGYSLRPHFFYRLDSRQPSGEAGRYRWPTDLIARYLPPGEVGLVAFTTVEIEGRRARVYLPLARSAAPVAPYRLTMVSTTELTGASVLVTPVGGKPWQERKKLPVGPLVQGQPFDVTLPAFPRAGFYRIDVLGQTRTAGSITSPPLVIYHGAP